MKVIKPGKKDFIGNCRRCGCEFSYTLEELMAQYPLKFVNCPECGDEYYHPDQSVEYKPVMYNSTEVKPDWVTTSTDLPMKEIHLPKTNSDEVTFIGEHGTASDAVFWR